MGKTATYQIFSERSIVFYKARGCITEDEALRQLEVRHKKRQASIDAAYRKQQKDGMLPLSAFSSK